jgi:hypothetical protein
VSCYPPSKMQEPAFIRALIEDGMRALAAEDARRLLDAALTLVAEDAEHGVSRPRRLVMRRFANRPLDGAEPHLEPA